MLDEVGDFVLNSHGCREFKKLCDNLIFTKNGLMIQEL